MLYIVVALYEEAKPFIENYNLKKDNTSTLFQIFKNENIELIISGVGLLKSAIASSYFLKNKKISDKDFVINFGFCGSNCQDEKIANIIIANKINYSTGVSFYTDMIYKTPFKDVCLNTFNKIVDGNSCIENNIYYDMEAYGFYEAVSYFFKRDKIFIFKVISDINFLKEIDLKLVFSNMKILFDFLDKIKRFSEEDNLNDFTEVESDFIVLIKNNLKLTETMNFEFLNILKYLKLSKKNITDILKNVEKELKEKNLNNKKERKEYFEEFKRKYIK